MNPPSIPLLSAPHHPIAQLSQRDVTQELMQLESRARINKCCVKSLDFLCCGLVLALDIACSCCWLTNDKYEVHYVDPQGVRYSECTACQWDGVLNARRPPESDFDLYCRRDRLFFLFCCTKEGPEHYLVGQEQQRYFSLKQREHSILIPQLLPPPRQQMSAAPALEPVRSSPAPRAVSQIQNSSLGRLNGTFPKDISRIISEYVNGDVAPPPSLPVAMRVNPQPRPSRRDSSYEGPGFR